MNINLRQVSMFYGIYFNNVNYGEHYFAFPGPKIWEPLFFEKGNSNPLTGFKSKTKHLKLLGCPCKLCNIYLLQGGYL